MDYVSWYTHLVNLPDIRPAGIHNMCTVNALCLESLPEFLDEIVKNKIEEVTNTIKFFLAIKKLNHSFNPLIRKLNEILSFE